MCLIFGNAYLVFGGMNLAIGCVSLVIGGMYLVLGVCILYLGSFIWYDMSDFNLQKSCPGEFIDILLFFYYFKLFE